MHVDVVVVVAHPSLFKTGTSKTRARHSRGRTHPFSCNTLLSHFVQARTHRCILPYQLAHDSARQFNEFLGCIFLAKVQHHCQRQSWMRGHSALDHHVLRVESQQSQRCITSNEVLVPRSRKSASVQELEPRARLLATRFCCQPKMNAVCSSKNAAFDRKCRQKASLVKVGIS